MAKSKFLEWGMLFLLLLFIDLKIKDFFFFPISQKEQAARLFKIILKTAIEINIFSFKNSIYQ